MLNFNKDESCKFVQSLLINHWFDITKNNTLHFEFHLSIVYIQSKRLHACKYYFFSLRIGRITLSILLGHFTNELAQPKV